MAEAGEKLKVFISYSRKDSAAFVDDLVVGLEDRGFAPMLDRHDIKPGEPWEARLGGLIKLSDTVVFVVSPEAVKSEICGWEVDKTLALSKRLLPVIYKSVPDAEIPPKLRELQFIPFHTAPGVTRPLRELAEALRVDLPSRRKQSATKPNVDSLRVRLVATCGRPAVRSTWGAVVNCYIAVTTLITALLRRFIILTLELEVVMHRRR